MNPLRISIVQYLNTAPLVRGFTHGPLQGKYQLSFTVPSSCAQALRNDAADLAIIPAIEYQRIDDLVLLPGLSIASKRSVRSLLLVSRKPIHEVRRIALDRSSRSTQALVRILCVRHWGIDPEFFEAEPNLPAMLERAEAALLIGDPALRLALEHDSAAAAPGRITPTGLRTDTPVWVYDVVEQWRSLTGLPAVLAVWAARRDRPGPGVVQDFQDSLTFGLQHLEEISAEASREMGLPATALRRYLAEHIDYTLDEENLAGLRCFFSLAAELDLVPAAKKMVFAPAGGPAGASAQLTAVPRR